MYGSIHSSANIIRFKVDVHQHFDRKPKFAIVPKYDKMVVHIFSSHSFDAREAIKLYHNVPVVIDEQSPRFLLARLAWTIFPLLETFLKKGVKRRLLRKTEEGFTIKEQDAEICAQAWLSAKSRSASPTKRPRSNNTGAQDTYDLEIQDISDWEEQQRGRKKRRMSSIYGVPDSQSTDSREWLCSGWSI